MSYQNDIESQVKKEVTFDNVLIEKKSDNYSKYTEDNNTECVEVSTCCCYGISMIALFGSYIAYLVFGIIFLVKDYHVANSCEGSSLWAYVLVAIILSASPAKAKQNKEGEEFHVILCTLFCVGLIEAGLAIWGGIELWNKSCDDLSDSNLWKFGLVTFCMQAFFAGLFLVIIPLLFLTCAICDRK